VDYTFANMTSYRPGSRDSDQRTSGEQEQLSAGFIAELRSRSQSDGEVFESLHRDLHRIARAKMRRERPDHTLQATALINEVFLKLFRTTLPSDFWDDTARAVRFIANAMEQVLNDHADAHRALKRGGDVKRRVPIDEHQAREFGSYSVPADIALFIEDKSQDEAIFAIREALVILRRTSPRQAEVIQLHFYGGLSYEEIAAALSLSLETVKLDARKAKAFLKVHLATPSQ
jgi:RNA polymerase sigma factor (TIGR02999 family)